MSDVQAVMWICAPLGTHSVHVWILLVCVPMCEAHSTHQLHSSNVSVQVCVSTSRATTASVHTVCVVWTHARCVVHGSATHTLNKGTEMLHNAQWLTRSLMLAHHTAVAMGAPPITKTRSADMPQHPLGSDGPKCQVCVFPSKT